MGKRFNMVQIKHLTSTIANTFMKFNYAFFLVYIEILKE